MKSLARFACFVIHLVEGTDPLSAALGPDGVSAMGGIGQRGPVAYVPNSMLGVQKAFQAMAFLPLAPPEPTVFIDPNLLSTEDACERDYKAKCPQGFVVVGDVFGDGVRCAADLAKYQGLCRDRSIKFVRLTVRAKQHWSLLCGFQWPCLECERDYSEPCPKGWTLDLSDPTVNTACLAPPLSYEGPCESKANFAGLTPAAKRDWSEECSVYWKCKQG